MTNRILKVLIVDDEPLARQYIRRLLEDESSVEIIGESGNGRDAARFISENSPDLVFLDVQMPELDGIAMLKTLGAEKLPAIIFTTAYEEFAIRAFEFHALDYLLKPFDQIRFKQSLDYALERLNNVEQQEDKLQRLSELLRGVEQKPVYSERLLVKLNGRIVFLKTGEIDWIEADDKYVHLRFGNSNYLVRQTLSALKAQLDPQLFVQINRSVLVNVERIKELQPMFAGDYTILLEDNTELVLSRNYKDQVFARLGKPF